MAQLIRRTQNNYAKRTCNMKDKNIYKLWTEFINNKNYNQYIILPTMLEKFLLDLNKVKNYIDIYKIRPLYSSKDKNVKKMSIWIGTSQENYSKKSCNMKHENIIKL